jgi:uncharacterized protein YjiS (DUF1127 family)
MLPVTKRSMRNMGRTVPTVRQLINQECQEWIKMAKVLPEEERKALRELLDVALTRSDAGSIVPRPLQARRCSY